MTQGTLISSGLSFDDENPEAVIGFIKVLVEQFFVGLEPFEQATDPISAISYSSKRHKKLLREKIDVLNCSVKSLFNYVIVLKISPISLKASSQHNLAKQCIKSLAYMIMNYPIADVSSFINKLIIAFKFVLRYEDFEVPTTFNDEAPNIARAKVYNKDITIEIFLQILYLLITRVVAGEAQLLEIIYEILSYPSTSIQYLALKCLSRINSFSWGVSFAQIRIIMNYAQINLCNMQKEFKKIDDLATLSLRNVAFGLPKHIVILLGRELLGYLSSLDSIASFKFATEVFKIIRIFFESDHAGCRLSASIFTRIFSFFYVNDTFLELCRKIADVEDNFCQQLVKNYASNAALLPAIMKVFPETYTDFIDMDHLEHLPIKILYQICAQANSIHTDTVEYVISCIAKERPSEDLLLPLMDIAEKALVPHLPEYSISTIYEVISSKKVLLDPDTKEKIITLAANSQKFPIISYFSLVGNKDGQFDSILREAANDLSSYEHKTYIDALARRFPEELDRICPPDLIMSLVRTNRLQSVIFIANNKVMNYMFLEQIFRIIEQEPGYEASAAFCVLRRIQNLREIVNINRFMCSRALFNLTRPNTPSPIGVVMRRERFKNLTTLLRIEDLASLKSSIISILVHDKNMDAIDEYIETIDPESRNKEKEVARKEFITPLIPEVFAYLLSHCDRHEVSLSVKFLVGITKDKPTNLIFDKLSKFSSFLLMNLGHPTHKVREQTRLGINIIVKLIVQKNDKNPVEALKFFWQQNFLATIHFYSGVLTERYNCNKKMVLKSLCTGLEFIAEILHQLYPKLTSIIDLAIKDVKLQKLCIIFWQKFFEYEFHSETLKHLFGHVITQVIPFFDEYPQQVTKVLHTLIVNHGKITKINYPEVAHISIFYERKELSEIGQILKLGTNKIEWQQQITLLKDQIESASPPLRRHLLSQLLFCMKQHENELSDMADELLHKLWLIMSHETTPELLVLCGRCMTMLPFVQNAQPPEVELINRDNRVDIIVSLIKDFLIKVLDDSSNVSYHDHAAYAIQELLKQLMGSGNDSSSDDKKKKKKKKSDNTDDEGDYNNKEKHSNHKHHNSKQSNSKQNNIIDCTNNNNNSNENNSNWERIPENIRNIIEPFKTSKYLHAGGRKTEIDQTPLAMVLKDAKKWLSLWTGRLMAISMNKNSSPDDASIFYCCEVVLHDSPALTRYIIPYLIAYNSKNETFLESVRSEWRAVYELIDDPQYLFFAKDAMRMFFQLFDVLNKWKIAAGSMHHRGKWKSLEIADDLDLAKAAYKCELYIRSLQHLEFYIIEHRNKKDCMRLLNSIYQNIDDPDSIKAFVKLNLDKLVVDESMSSKEINYLTLQRKTDELIPFVSEMLKNGRAERALTDALSLKRRAMDYEPKLDSIIASSAIVLMRWNELSQLVYTETSTATHDLEAMINISVGKLLFFLKANKKNEFCNELCKSRDFLAQSLSNVSMMSYHKLIPILVRFRILEEVEEFSSAQNRPEFAFGQWNKQSELSVDDVELIASVRCALIDISQRPSKLEQFSEQWLQLAKMSRKSESLFRAEMFCARAKHFAENPEACDFEIAKIVHTRQLPGQVSSLSLLRTSKISSQQLRGKIKYTRAKWSEEMNSEDSNKIISMYKKSIEYLKSSAKAFFSLAAFVDQRATSYIHFNEEASDSNVQQQRRSKSAKFWNTSSPLSISQFLKEMIPMALENYINCMISSPQYSYEVIPRVLLLFFDVGRYFTPDTDKGVFENLSKNQKEQILLAMRDSMKKVDEVVSSVWLNAITQLISRVEQLKSLEDILFKLIKLSVVAYPEPSLWHLMSICHSKSPSRSPKFDAIWEYVKKDLPPKQCSALDSTRITLSNITNQLIALCSLTSGSSKANVANATILCPKLVSDLKDCFVLMPLLSTLTVRFPGGNVGNMQQELVIESMGENINLLKSLQKPKKIQLKARGGRSFHYLCKKDDDLRKDMRMMEFASFINRIFAFDRRCRQRDLAIVTYAVICLNEVCGMMEWVENTRSFRCTITKMLKHQKIEVDFQKIKEIYIDTDKLDPAIIAKKLYNFTQILLPMMPPVLHIWFASRFKDVAKWFQARLLYTRSTAVWSMVGYIVGLGDRHAENILLNRETGSCVHVDFNCMFDRSKSLPIPEVVPFRLTQNIIDGMGVLNTEGPFTATSSLIMETLRAKKLKLISVLQTFIHDPLLEWKKGSKATTETTAKMTLKEVERRLGGLSDDRSTVLSPECIVKELIKQASDPGLLSQMYVGWQSYY